MGGMGWEHQPKTLFLFGGWTGRICYGSEQVLGFLQLEDALKSWLVFGAGWPTQYHVSKALQREEAD